jgi:hypothetical protein
MQLPTSIVRLKGRSPSAAADNLVGIITREAGARWE